MYCNVLKYLQVKYGSVSPTTMTLKDAETMGIPFPQRPGWLKKHGADELGKSQVFKMIAAVASSATKKTSEKNMAVLSKQLARLLAEWPDAATYKSLAIAKNGTKNIAASACQNQGKQITACKKDDKPVFKKPYDGFYESREWRELRYKALVLHGATCQCCGTSRKDGARLHVDHIKPRSKFPKLQLDLSNLQVLCEDCNLGKSNKGSTDWRG